VTVAVKDLIAIEGSVRGNGNPNDMSIRGPLRGASWIEKIWRGALSWVVRCWRLHLAREDSNRVRSWLTPLFPWRVSART
jgi:hypothetical protein